LAIEGTPEKPTFVGHFFRDGGIFVLTPFVLFLFLITNGRTIALKKITIQEKEHPSHMRQKRDKSKKESKTH